jgi:hypothetical protein
MSETSSAGEIAETGAIPDAAPQYPLKISDLSPAA